MRRWERSPERTRSTRNFAAIEKALTRIRDQSRRTQGDVTQVCIFCDNKRALNIIGSPGGKKWQATQKIYRLLNDIEEAGVVVRFRWIPAHEGILGNETAHRIAKLATAPALQPTVNSWPHHSIIHQGKISPQEKRARFQRGTAGAHIKCLDKALPGKHARELYNLSREPRLQRWLR